MAWTQTDVDALKKAIAGGVSSVRFADGRQVDYRSIADLKAALDMAQAEVNSGSALTGGSVSYASFSKD